MQNLLSHLRLHFLLLAVFGVAYPCLILGLGTTLPGKAAGRTVSAKGRTVGFALIGQANALPQYFHPRPSAVGYNAAATGGSNKGPTNPAYLAEVEDRVKALIAENPNAPPSPIPADLVTASGSGIDPDISPEAARYQAARVARARGLPLAQIQTLIQTHTQRPLAGLFGPERVNVLQLNLALDQPQ